MKPVAEIAPFLAVAVALHAGAFGFVVRGGVSSGGDGGSGQITLEGGDPGVAALVATWDRPPDVAPLPPAITDLAPRPDHLPRPHDHSAPALPALPAMARPADALESAPDPTPPAPPVTLPDAPVYAPDLPDISDMATLLPPDPVAARSTSFAGLFNQYPAVSDTPEAMPDSTPPPPPAIVAHPPERSPHPPARPQTQPRTEPQTARPRTAQSAPPAGAAAPAQRAAGSGAQGHEGQAGRASTTSRAQGDTGGLVAQWGGAIRGAVQRQQRHPAGTRAGGTVHLRLDVRSDGRLLAVALHESSGHAALDQAAIEAVRRARLPSAPQGLSGSFQFNLPVRFRG